MKTLLSKITLFVSILFLLNACVKDTYDGPDSDCVLETPTGTAITIKALLDKPAGLISVDEYIEGTVISSDKEGNFFKQLIIQDSTGGISININQTGLNSLFPINRNVYVNLNGLWLSDDTYKQLGANVDNDRLSPSVYRDFVKKGPCFQTLEPEVVSISDLGSAYVNKLVTINDVEFTDGWKGMTFNDPASIVGSTGTNINITDCQSEVILRSSTFASFANDTISKKNGSITGVFSIYFTGDQQLYIRDLDDIKFEAERCDGKDGGTGGGGGSGLLNKDFEDMSITSGGWITFQEDGSDDWEINTYSGTSNARINTWDGSSNQDAEVWLISPAMDLSAVTDPVAYFRNSYNHGNGDFLLFKVSTDYVSGDPTNATWTDKTFTLSPGGWDWEDSGNILLPTSANVHIAFKYVSTTSQGSTWQVDEIVVAPL